MLGQGDARCLGIDFFENVEGFLDVFCGLDLRGEDVAYDSFFVYYEGYASGE